jgi:hypothetical protein
LATAKSKEKCFEVMKKLLNSGKGEFMFSSSSASSSSGLYTPLSCHHPILGDSPKFIFFPKNKK